MPLKYAKDMPEARSKLLRYLTTSAADDWAMSARRIALPVPPEVSPEPKADLPERLAIYTHDLISTAELFWAHEAFSHLAAESGKTLPAFRCHPDMLPARTGLLVWADPVASRITSIGRQAARGFAWKADEDGVWVIGYDDSPVFSRPELAAVTIGMGWLAESTSFYLPWRDELLVTAPTNAVATEKFSETWLRCAVSTWLLMEQRALADVQSGEALRPADRRRFERRGHPTTPARIVSIAGGHGNGGGGESDREYQSRWVVSGHWRNQPWGPKGAYRRPTWIAPYIKGPEDAPILHSERVHTIR